MSKNTEFGWKDIEDLATVLLTGAMIIRGCEEPDGDDIDYAIYARTLARAIVGTDRE